MTTENQKEGELASLKGALDALNISYSMIDSEGESPDFIISVNGDCVGVEITDLYCKNDVFNAAKTQSDISRIFDIVVKKYDELNRTPKEFGFVVSGHSGVFNMKKTAEELAIYIHNKIPETISAVGNESLRLKVEIENKELGNWISCFTVAPTLNNESSYCVASSFSTVNVDHSTIEKILEQKSNKLPTYKLRCSKVWLLIVLPAMQLAADFRLNNEIELKSCFGFDGVIIFDRYRNQVKALHMPNN